MRRVTNLPQSQQEDMICHSKEVLAHSPGYGKQELLHAWYVSARKDLLAQHRVLVVCFILLLIGCLTMFWVYRRNRRLMAALADLQEEIKERPEAIRGTTRQLSDALYASDWYLADAPDGEAARFTADNWAEIER